jgi:hypothetical protein
MYSNARFDGGSITKWTSHPPGTDVFSSRLLRSGYAAVHSTRTNTFSYGTYDIQYKTTSATAASGYWLLHIGMPLPGGLTATFFDNTDLTNPACDPPPPTRPHPHPTHPWHHPPTRSFRFTLGSFVGTPSVHRDLTH